MHVGASVVGVTKRKILPSEMHVGASVKENLAGAMHVGAWHGNEIVG